MSRIEIGVSLPTMPDPAGGRPPSVTRLARHVEALGLGSVWVPDVLLGDGTPGLEAVTTLGAVAGVTERVDLGFGVLVLPVRAPAWLGAQLVTLQQLSGDRVLLGVGAGGFPDSPFWRALDVPAEGRGRRADAVLRSLPSLVAGQPTRLGAEGEGPELTLAPGAAMPPVLVGGNSAVAMRRAARLGDGWFPSLIGPPALATKAAELRAVAADHGRAVPEITVGGHILFGEGERLREAHENLVNNLMTVHGLDRAEAESVPMPGSGPAAAAEHVAAYADAGATRVVFNPDAPDEAEWMRQAELLAEVQALLG